MQPKQTFSAQTLTLSVAAAELGRAIFGAGQTGSVRAVLLSNVLAAAAFVLLAALASVNASRLNRPGFAGKCICAVFLLWYLFELVRTAAMLQQACWEQFASMAFIGLLPFFLWAGWSLGCELYDRMASVLGWLVVLGIVFCVLGLAGQLQWQVLVTGETAHSFVLPDASFGAKIMRESVKSLSYGFQSLPPSFPRVMRWGWPFFSAHRRLTRAMSC